MTKFPECPREDCRFAMGEATRTCMYFQPIFNKDGVNINPDANTTTFDLNCHSCGKSWVGITTYEEVL